MGEIISEERGEQESREEGYNDGVAKVRLDVLLTKRGLAESRARAQALILAGQVRVKGQITLKPGTMVGEDVVIEVISGPRFVSRGGEKLDAALSRFGLDVHGLVCADVGASTGGFTDCLLQRGAHRVYAIDVGKGVLHWKLRNDPRVIVMEQTNARFLEALPEPIDLVTVDASFISLKLLLPALCQWLRPAEGRETSTEQGAGIVALIKPQFEAGRQEAARGEGVIRDPAIHRQVLLDILTFAQQQGLGIHGLMRSPLLGPKGNVEFLVWWRPGRGESEPAQWVERVMKEA